MELCDDVRNFDYQFHVYINRKVLVNHESFPLDTNQKPNEI